MIAFRSHHPTMAALLVVAACSNDSAPAKPSAEAPKPAPAAVAPAATAATAAGNYPNVDISPRRYSEVPTPGSPAAIDTTPPKLALRLIGVVTIAGRRVATFSDGTTVHTVGPGDALGSDWKLVSIDDENTIFFHNPTGREWQWKTAQFRGDGSPALASASGSVGSTGASPTPAPASQGQPRPGEQRAQAPSPTLGLPASAQLPPDAPPSLFQPMSPANPTIPSTATPPQGIGTAAPANLTPPQGAAPVYPRQVTPQGNAPKTTGPRP